MSALAGRVRESPSSAGHSSSIRGGDTARCSYINYVAPSDRFFHRGGHFNTTTLYFPLIPPHTALRCLVIDVAETDLTDRFQYIHQGFQARSAYYSDTDEGLPSPPDFWQNTWLRPQVVLPSRALSALADMMARRSRVRVIQHRGQDRTRQALFPVGKIRAIPFFTAYMESSAQVPDQGHKSPIRPFDRHPGKGCLLRGK